MLQCWSFNPEERPMFIYCLDVLMELKRKTASSQTYAIHTDQESKQGKETSFFLISYGFGDIGYNIEVKLYN